MKITIAVPLLAFSILALVIVSATITYFVIRQRQHKKIRKEKKANPLIDVYREKENVLRVWYSVLAGLDTFFIAIGTLSNATAIYLSSMASDKQNWIIALMIISLVSYSLKDTMNLSSLRKTYIKATRHLELGIDNFEYVKDSKGSPEDLHKTYVEAQKIIEEHFE